MAGVGFVGTVLAACTGTDGIGGASCAACNEAAKGAGAVCDDCVPAHPASATHSATTPDAPMHDGSLTRSA